VVAALAGAAGLALRGRSAFRAADIAYLRLDREVFANEHQRDELARANADLGQANRELGEANIQLRLYQSTLRSLLRVVDSRSDGQLRDLVSETTGAELSDLEEPQRE
jgi:hypothetical protein